MMNGVVSSQQMSSQDFHQYSTLQTVSSARTTQILIRFVKSLEKKWLVVGGKYVVSIIFKIYYVYFKKTDLFFKI